MSIRHGVLALLAERPRYGYELRAEFEARTGGTWPLNVGQVYTTLSRLERDGLVAAQEQDDAEQRYYAVTEAGLAEVREWFTTPVRRESRPRDELAIKLALAVGAPGLDIAAVLQAQRSDSLRALQDYIRLKARAGGEDDLAWALVLEAMIFQAEAEVRWLDHCEARLLRAAQRTPAAAPAASAPARRAKAAR